MSADLIVKDIYSNLEVPIVRRSLLEFFLLALMRHFRRLFLFLVNCLIHVSLSHDCLIHLLGFLVRQRLV